MPLIDRFILCSAFAATLLYLIYRRRPKSKRSTCQDTSKVFEEIQGNSYLQLCSAVNSLTPELGSYVEFIDTPFPVFAKVTSVTSLCVAHPQSNDQVCVIPEVVSRRINIESDMLDKDRVSPVNVDVLETSVGSGSEHALTPDSAGSCTSPELLQRILLPPGGFNDPSNDIYEDIPEEMNGTILPKVLIPSDLWAEAVDQDVWHETFFVPAHMGGVLIGRLGKNVRELKNIWQAEFSLNTCPGRQDTLVFKLSCPVKHKDDVLHWVSKRFRMRPSRTPIGNPNQLKRYLPFGEPVPVHVRSLYAAKEFFVTIQDEEYEKYTKMQTEMDADYNSVNNFRMQLCEPVTAGTVAVVPHSQGFARALIISVYSTWPKCVLYFLLDHGTFGIVTLNKLRKIRAKYMRIPFQAIHVSWSHAFPVFSDVPDIHILRTFFNSGRVHAFAVRMETCCRAAVAFGEPYPPPYSTNGLLDILVNAYNSGLYMVVPLAVYPNRQSWLNGTDIPYHPFVYSPIDYSSLVTFLAEDVSPEHQQYSPDDCQLKMCDNFQQYSTKQQSGKNRGVQFSRRSAVWNQRNNARGNIRSKVPGISQKENQGIPNQNNVTDSIPINTTPVSFSEPRRRPLGVQNNSRGANVVRPVVANRGRNGQILNRKRD